MSRLAELDADIQERMQRYNLFAELNDDEAYYNELATALHEVRSHMTPQQIAKNVPHAVSYFLVLHGMFHYQGGDFWQNFLNLDANHKTIWSKMFLETLGRYGMPRFDALIEDQTALPYITRFLMHGGIPRYSLPDYFRDFLSRYLRAVKRTNISLQQYKQEWLELSHQVDRPVIRFLEYGGTFAQDWAERTVQMAMLVDEYIKRNKSITDLPPTIYRDARVPTWVTEAFWNYRKTAKAVEVRTQEIKAPVVSLLYEQTIVIDFPPQELLLGTENHVSWVCTFGASGLTNTETIPVFAHARGHLLHVEATAKDLDYCDEVFGMQIALHKGSEVVRAWSYPSDMLMFRQRGSQYVYQRGELKISGQVMHVLTQRQVDFLVDGALLEPQNDGDVYVYTIDGTSCEEVLCDGQLVPFVESADDLGPRLVDGQTIALLQPSDAAHVYDILPNVDIPLSRNSTAEQQLQAWRMVIINETTDETVRNRARLVDLVGAVERRDRHLVVSLATLRMRLDPGLYRIELSDGVRSARLYYYFLPGFNVEGQSACIIPLVAVTRPSVTIRSVPEGWRIDHENQRVKPSGETVLTYPEGTESGVILLRCGVVELTIPVVFPHVHISLVDKTGAELAVNTPYQKDATWYQENLPVVEARVTPWNAPDIPHLKISVVVEVAQNDVTQVLPVRSNAVRRWFVVDSAAASDTITHSLGGNAQLILTIETAHETKSQPILTLQKMVNVENLRVTWTPVLDNYRVTAQWNGPESPSNWRMVFWSRQRPWQNIDMRPIPAHQTEAKYIVTKDDFRPGESYVVGIVSVNRNNAIEDGQQRSTSGAPVFPPDSTACAELRVPGDTMRKTHEDYIAALFTGVKPNTALLTHLSDQPPSNDEMCIKVNYRLLVRLHQEIVQMHWSDALVAVQEVFEKELRPKVVQIYQHNRMAFLIAMLKLTNQMRQFTLFERELVQYLAQLLSQDLFDVLLKAEIRGSVAESHIEAFLQRALSDAEVKLLRKHGVFLVEEYDEAFVPNGETDAVYWHGILREMVNPSWREAMNADQNISYEDAVLATSLITSYPASEFQLHQQKNARIRAWRERLMPVIQVWLIRTAITEHLPLKMPVAAWWDHSGAEAVLRKLNSYTPDRGDLRDYLIKALP
jgi:hypothetical protein